MKPEGVVAFIRHGTRAVHIAGITPNPDSSFMAQVARNLTDTADGFLIDKRYLILDRDTKFTDEFRRLLRGAGIEWLRTPYRSPNCNAVAERFVKSIKDERLNRMIHFGDSSLRHALAEYETHYMRERTHQGIGNQLVERRDPVHLAGHLRYSERLGGLLRSYHRVAA